MGIIRHISYACVGVMMISLRMMDPIWLSEERALTSRNLALFQVTLWGPMTMDRDVPFLSLLSSSMAK